MGTTAQVTKGRFAVAAKVQERVQYHRTTSGRASNRRPVYRLGAGFCAAGFGLPLIFWWVPGSAQPVAKEDQ